MGVMENVWRVAAEREASSGHNRLTTEKSLHLILSGQQAGQDHYENIEEAPAT